MQLSLPQVLGLVDRAIRSTSPNFAINTVLRAMEKIILVVRANDSLRHIMITLPEGVPPDLSGWQPKRRRKDCKRCP